MYKSFIKIAFVLSFFPLIFCIGCKRQNDNADIIPDSITHVDEYTLYGSQSRKPLVNETAVEAAFLLDYRPLRAEGANETISAAFFSGSDAGNSRQSAVFGGGLRNLSEYATVYFDPLREEARIEEIRAAQTAALSGRIESSNEEPLYVVDWGPRGEYSSAIQRPSIYVIFSQPMVPLASLGAPLSSSPIVSISPSIKGTFRWYGTSLLSFEGEEPCQSQQIYTITVADNARSVYGNALQGERSFNFYTEPLSIINVNPGEDFRRTANFHFDNNNVPPEAAKQIGLEFNYPVRANEISPFIEIFAGNRRIRFNVRQDNEYNISALLQEDVDFDTQVRIVLISGAKSAGGSRGTPSDQVYSFRTPGPFSVTSFYRYTGYGRYANIVDIYFSHALYEDSVQGAVRTVPVMPVGSANIEVFGNILRVSNLPVSYGDRFSVLIDGKVQDVFGRSLGTLFSAGVVMPNEPPPQGDVRFLDYRRNVMLESQFADRYLFEYLNISHGSSYYMASAANPYLITNQDNMNWTESAQRFDLLPGTVNSRYFEEIDLKPYLNAQGKGFIGFRADIELITQNWQRDDTYIQGTRRLDSSYSIQVTDLGLTVRYAFNKAAVMVTSLSTGRPVEGALVKLLAPAQVYAGIDLSEIGSFGEAVTDSSGLAVIDMAPSVFRNATANPNTWLGYDTLFVYAQKEGDRAVFSPNSHNTWSFAVTSATPQLAEEIVPVSFLFSDRGLYKPGETLTFRGVDRSRALGMYTVYSGSYTIVLEENTYRPQQIAVIQGETTGSGSFFGSVDIPEDLDPGSYRLVYRRGEGTDGEIIANVPVTVAFFERLRFQASLSSPPAPVIMGDDINLNLQASYLAGGSLAGASYEAAWFEEMTIFRPPGSELRSFSFGPSRGWDSKRYIAFDSGVLSGQGTASLGMKTGGSKITGSPYLYEAEARVTDISNQMITAYRSVFVHPASFYIGLYKSPGGFARAGQELSFDFVAVNVNGEKLANNALFLHGAGQLKAELVREEWRRIQQRGVSGYIYDEYSPVQIVESEQTINVQNGGGVIKVRPTSAGYHILRVSGTDSEGRTALSEYAFYVTGSGGYWNMSNPAEIRLTPDMEMYEPGDTAQILMQSALPEGYYLITVEREGIFTEEVRYFDEPVNVIEVPIARNYVPVVYVSVSSYSVRSGPPSHEYGSPDLDKPKGYYGVTRVNVDPRVRAFSVQVETDKPSYRPGEEVTVTLTATRDGRPLSGAELSLMAVDRGVLDLINYHVPDPIEYFYSQGNFPLFAAGGDSRYLLMDPVTYSVKNLAGGDAEGGSKIEERKDFNPTAVFEPMLITDDNGKVICKFRLPDSLTTYRVTVFGVRGDLFALKESEITAANIINVQEVVPRRLRERDTAEAGVLITNLDSASVNLTVRLDIGGPLAASSSGLNKPAGQAFVDGTAERAITVRSGESAVVYFDVAAVKEGNVTLNFTVRSNVLNERIVREIIIERPYIMETVTTTGIIDGSSRAEGLVIPSFADIGAGNLASSGSLASRGSLASGGSLTISLDATRLSLLDSAVTYLFGYPYGCLEQRSSALMPLVVFVEYLDALSLKSEVSDPFLVIDSELRYWAGLQLSTGGFAYWPSGTRADFYVSLRIAHVIAIAQAKGFAVPSSLNVGALTAYLNREYQVIQRWTQQSEGSYYYQSYLQSYMLYVLALLGERVDASRLAEILARNNADSSVLAFAGMTYRLLGRTIDAANTAQRLRNLVRMTVRGAEITDPLSAYRYNYYGGPTEQLALALQFFAQQYPGDEINTRLLFSLLEECRGGYWQSTAVTARVLCAIDALIRAEDLVNLNVTGSVMLAGNSLLTGTFAGLGARPVTQTFDFNDPLIARLQRDTVHTLNFTRSGTNSLYYTASLRYAIPSELQSFRDEGIGVFMAIYDVETGEEVAGSALLSGKTYRARVRLSSSRDRSFLALRVPVPSGAEILDAAFVTTASYADAGGTGGNISTPQGSWISHQVILDNEVQYFWDQFYRGETAVSFLFRTARRGVYPTPPVQAECMYEPEIFGRSRGLLYTIE